MNYKVKVNNEAESKEVQELFFELGYTWSGDSKDIFDFDMPEYIVNWNNGYITVGDDFDKNRQEITLQQIRDLVVLKRNDIADATHEDKDDPKFKYRLMNNWWHVITKDNPIWRKDSIEINEVPLLLKPITKEETKMKEYLDPENDYKLEVTDKPFFDWIEVPEGSNYAYENDLGLCFLGVSMGNNHPLLVWQRPQHPEELPFIDNEPKHSHYFKDVTHLSVIDVYDILKLFNVTDPCLQHIVKKALCAGQRGHKDLTTDLQNILDTAKRAVELNK